MSIVFKKNTLFTFFTVVAFLFLMALASITYNRPGDQPTNSAQELFYKKSTTFFAYAFSGAAALTDLNLSQNIAHSQQVKERQWAIKIFRAAWSFIGGQRLVSPESSLLPDLPAGDNSGDSLANEKLETLADLQHFLNSLIRVREMSRGELGRLWLQSWQNIKLLYQDFITTY